MSYKSRLIFCVIVVAMNEVTFADKENTSEEILEENKQMDAEVISYNGTSGETIGVADSHEAMNNREVYPTKHKTKRSYEFLLGLINNNSRYEVTRREPTTDISNHQTIALNGPDTEDLLKLLIKIASHPDKWHRIHKLLRKIDNDISRSKKLIQDFDSINFSRKRIEDEWNENNQYQISPDLHVAQKPKTNVQLFTTVAINHDLNTKPPQTLRNQNHWNKMNNLNTVQPLDDDETDLKRLELHKQKSTKSPIRKQFIYHKVTGRPLYIDKTTKSYIAVSVIAPKINTNGREDAELEKELQQLKPWEQQTNES